MKVFATSRVEGLRECEQALKNLPKATARNVLRRVLLARAQPMVATMRSLAPNDQATAAPDLSTNIFASTRVKNDVGKAEFAGVMRAGGTKKEAAAAMREARRDAAGEGSFAEVYAGPDVERFYGRFQEDGTPQHAAQPFMRPAWDQHRESMLFGIAGDLWRAIKEAAARYARKLAKAKR